MDGVSNLLFQEHFMTCVSNYTSSFSIDKDTWWKTFLTYSTTSTPRTYVIHELIGGYEGTGKIWVKTVSKVVSTKGDPTSHFPPLNVSFHKLEEFLIVTKVREYSVNVNG